MGKFFNRYSLIARIYPALLALGPALCSALVLFPRLTSNIRLGAASTLAVACMFYLLASLARSRGKSLEQKLIGLWGGWPTTLVLRHRDTTIDPITKGRYHQALSGMGVDLPTEAEEIAAPIDADHAYRSATKRLIELRRGRTFQMVEDENASYGFRRNLLGLKSVAISVAALAAIATGLVWWSALAKPVNMESLGKSITTYPYLPVLLLFDLAYMFMFLLLIGRDFVRQAADEYALALFRTLDQVLAQPPKRRSRVARSGS
jgi:hypothetical protein